MYLIAMVIINVCNVHNSHVQIVGAESINGSMDDRSTYDLRNILAIQDSRDCKNVEHHP